MATITDDELAAELAQIASRASKLSARLASATDPGVYTHLIDDLDDLAAVTKAILCKLDGHGDDVPGRVITRASTRREVVAALARQRAARKDPPR
jgi:hypothetical protein